MSIVDDDQRTRGKIFLNYRRADSSIGFTQALFARLEEEFTSETILMAELIEPVEDFVEAIRNEVLGADVLLAIIGSSWTELLKNSREDDFVVLEIRTALESGKRVIPVLVDGASMPRADSLPESIRSLALRNAVRIRSERFKADSQGLVAVLKDFLGAAAEEKALSSDAERRLAEAQRKKREAEEGERIAAAEAREQMNWEAIRASSDPQDFRDHIARYPNGQMRAIALGALEDLSWKKLGPASDGYALLSFMNEFPESTRMHEAKLLLSNRKSAVELENQKLARIATVDQVRTRPH
jgi:hypothetical protein